MLMRQVTSAAGLSSDVELRREKAARPKSNRFPFPNVAVTIRRWPIVRGRPDRTSSDRPPTPLR